MDCFRVRRWRRASREDREEEREQARHSEVIDEQLRKESISFRATHRLLVLGASKSEKNTILQQIKILQEGYTDAERVEKVADIYSNIREIILTVVRAMSELKPPAEVADPQNKGRVKYLLEMVAKPDFNDYTPEFFNIVSELWKDTGVSDCFARSKKCQLIDNADYFMDEHKLKELASPGFMPSDQDILHSHTLTSGIFEIALSMDKVQFRIFDINNQKMESSKWLKCLGDITAAIFVVDCSAFDVGSCVEGDKETKNHLQESLDLFERFWNNRYLNSVSYILLLNKIDVLKRKLEGGQKLEDYFPEFATYSPPEIAVLDPGESILLHRAKFFIRDQFVKIATNTQTERSRHWSYPHFISYPDHEVLRTVIFNSCRDIIQRIHHLKYELF